MKHLIVDSEGIKLAEMPEWRTEIEESKAIAEAKLFEDQERVKELLRPQFYSKEWDKTETEFLKLPTGTYPLPPDFPEYVEVRQQKCTHGKYKGEWIKPNTSPEWGAEYRTILRFVDEECPECGVKEGFSHKEGCKYPRVDLAEKLRNSVLFRKNALSEYVDKQEERKGESQEGLWDDFWGELIAEGFDTENCKRVQGKYTIKRK